jgi:hypothetical protein
MYAFPVGFRSIWEIATSLTLHAMTRLNTKKTLPEGQDLNLISSEQP